MVVVVVVVVVIVCPVAGLKCVYLAIVGDVYDVGPPGACSLSLDMDVGLVECPLDDRTLVLFETFNGDSVAGEVSGSLLRPEADPGASLS